MQAVSRSPFLFGLLMAWCACVVSACGRGYVAPFPPSCENRTTGLIVVDLSRGKNARLSVWAQSFASDYGIPVKVVDAPDELPADAFDQERSQWKLESLFDFVWTTASAEDERVIAMGVLTEDAYTTREPDLRWVFGVGTWSQGKNYGDTKRHTLVISTWRMNPRSYRHPGNPALMDDRMSKFVARQLGGLHCGMTRSGDDASPMRPRLRGVGDLDEIDRSAW